MSLRRETFEHQGTTYHMVLGSNPSEPLSVEQHVKVANAMQPHTRKMRVRGDRMYAILDAWRASKVQS